MITLPKEFVATKFPGYFFNREDDKLYSLKIDGVLKPLKFYQPNQWNHLWRYSFKLESGESVTTKGGFYVSFHGMRKFYPIERLKEIKEHNATIPVKEKVNA